MHPSTHRSIDSNTQIPLFGRRQKKSRPSFVHRLIGKHGLLVFASIQCRKRSCEPTTEIQKAKERIPSKKPASRKSAQLLPYPDGPNVPLCPSRASSWLKVVPSRSSPGLLHMGVAHGCCVRVRACAACSRAWAWPRKPNVIITHGCCDVVWAL